MEDIVFVPEADLRQKTFDALSKAGADEASASGAVRAMMHASRLGIDSHGVRLARHYVRVMKGGRVNPRPQPTTRRTAAATATIDADDGLGHPAAYAAMDLAAALARESGIGAVGIIRSSHYGAAGAYALAGAEAGLIALSTTNTDSLVGLHGGRAPFHGTNPLAIAAPVRDEQPWLLDFATSSIPYNRVLLYRTLGRTLPDGVAADADGERTTDPAEVAMLQPLGGENFGFKGAGLAGVATLLSAILTGMTLDQDFIQMSRSDDISTPRRMGHFCIAIDPDRFAGRALYDEGMKRYLAALRAVPARPGESVMAPGDREWAAAEERRITGIPIDAETARFLGF